MSCVIMMPTNVGHQDLASLIARQPGVAERGRQHIRSVTTLTALHSATFSFPRPLGSTIPDAPGYQLASLDPLASDVTGSVRRRSDPFYDPFAERDRPPAPRYEFPTVDRRLKGDMLVRRELVPAAPATPQPAPSPRKKEDRLAPKISMPQPVPAVSAHEPFAIPQTLIANAERIDAQRRAAQARAAAAAREALLAMQPEVQAEPFAIAESDIAAAERVAAERVAAERLAAERLAAEHLADSKAAALAPKEQTAAAEPRRTQPVPRTEDAQPKAEAPQPVAEAKPAPVAYPDVVAWAQPATELFAISEDLIAESERIAVARAADAARRTEIAALTPPASNVPEVSADEDNAAEDSAGAPVVENDRILTDEEPGDDDAAATPAEPENPAMQMAKLYFGADSFGAAGSLEAYKPGEAPTLVPSSKIDPDIKLSALTPPADLPDYKRGEDAEKDFVSKPGVTNETIAPKGEVTGEGKRPRTPAERLGLTEATRGKQERCLANAIYFEARGEFERGQMAVAQVVMNRVFSPYYPLTVCGVVYQNAHKHNACQFTFACDNVRDVVNEPEAWERAKRIARDTLDGKIWLPEISKATHYHATYVSPWWKRTMNKYKTLGIHIFYRPKRWGDGSDEPTWDPSEVQATGSIKAPDKSRATAFNK